MRRSRIMSLALKAERARCALILITGLLPLTGCAVGPKYKTPSIQAPTTYKEIGEWKTAQPNEQNFGGNWWEIFQDLQLNALEQQINVSNQNLKAAVAQYEESLAALGYARADYYPTITTDPSATRERYSANRPASSAHGLTFNDFVLPLNLSYQTNAWGARQPQRRVLSRASPSQRRRPGRGLLCGARAGCRRETVERHCRTI